MSSDPTGTSLSSKLLTNSAMRCAIGTPLVWRPISTRSSAPPLRSSISWEMRTSARRISSEVSICRPVGACPRLRSGAGSDPVSEYGVTLLADGGALLWANKKPLAVAGKRVAAVSDMVAPRGDRHSACPLPASLDRLKGFRQPHAYRGRRGNSM